MIDLRVFVLGAAGFLSAFFIHIAVWRLKKPAKEITGLVFIFIGLPAIIYPFLLLALDQGQLSRANLVFSFLLEILLALSYIMTYPAIQAPSPSLRIILAASKFSSGLSAEDIRKLFPEEFLVNCAKDLAREGWVCLREERITLSPSGRLVSGFFSVYRALLKLPPGEG